MLERASKQNNYYYNNDLRQYARDLRNHSTKAEIYFWNSLLKNKQFKGYSFFRQRPVLQYIADFMCFELLLIIELDGEIHDQQEVYEKDRQRDKDLEEIGFTVIRFSNWMVFNQLDEVVNVLEEYVKKVQE
jgi:very-short-patch-repair endonuclease